MRKLSLILFLFMATVGITVAQQADGRRQSRTPEERAELMTNRMVKDLALTSEQASKLKEVNLAQAKKMETIWAKQTEDRKENREEARVALSSTEEKYKEILTPEQFEKYEKNKEERIDKRKGRLGERRFRN